MRRPSRCKGGFTLIELLVVISIITLLLGILLPALSRVQSLAGAVRSLSNLRQIVSATRIYAMDNDQMLPGDDAIIGGARNYHTPTREGLLGEGQYLEDYRVWLDPGDGGLRNGNRKQPATGPAQSGEDIYTFSYTMFGHLGDSACCEIEPRPLGEFQQPSDTIAYGEENTGHIDPDKVNGEVFWINDARFTNKDRTEPRHRNGKSQVGYLDGHAAAFPAYVQPWKEPKWNRWLKRSN